MKKKQKSWFGRHPVLTIFLVIFGLIFLGSLFTQRNDTSTKTTKEDYNSISSDGIQGSHVDIQGLNEQFNKLKQYGIIDWKLSDDEETLNIFIEGWDAIAPSQKAQLTRRFLDVFVSFIKNKGKGMYDICVKVKMVGGGITLAEDCQSWAYNGENPKVYY